MRRLARWQKVCSGRGSPSFTARRATRLVLVRDGAMLMLIQIDEVLIRADAEPTLTTDAVNSVIVAMADKMS